MKNLKSYIIILLAAVILNACTSAGGEFGGSEYMPDMVHSIAYEANVMNPYKYNTWDEESTIPLKDLSKVNTPVSGTIPRGYAGVSFAENGAAQDAMMAHLNGMTNANEIAVPINGETPYYYQDTQEGRDSATATIIDNPFPITEDGLKVGKELYTIYCGICHGDKGDGLGYLVDDAVNKNVKYPAAPKNFTTDEYMTASNGRFYHAIVYGLNVMGGYTDKLSYEERWQVIHYIRTLQAKKAGAVYNADENTFDASFGTPVSHVVVAGHASDEMPQEEEAEQPVTDPTHH